MPAALAAPLVFRGFAWGQQAVDESTVWTGYLKPLPAMRRDLLRLDHAQIFPLLRAMGKCILGYRLKNVEFSILLRQLGRLAIVYRAIMKLNHGAEPVPAKIQDNLFSILWMSELHPGLEIVKLHVG